MNKLLETLTLKLEVHSQYILVKVHAFHSCVEQTRESFLGELVFKECRRKFRLSFFIHAKFPLMLILL